MRIVTDCVRADRNYPDILATADAEARAAKPLPLLVNGLSGGATDALCAEVTRHAADAGHATLILVADDTRVSQTADALRAAGIRALGYPVRDRVFYRVSASHDVDRERLSVLRALQAGECDAVVATPTAAAQYTIPPAILQTLTPCYKIGDVCPPEELCTLLDRDGYARVENVEAAGQYARRGGILDLYPEENGRPVRLEFFGDEIDRVVSFDPLTQRTEAALSSVSLFPAKEILPDDEARARIRAAITKRLAWAEKHAGALSDGARATFAAELAAVDGGIELLFADKYLPLVYPESATLFSYLRRADARPFVFLLDTAAVKERFTLGTRFLAETIAPLLESGELDGTLARYALDDGGFDAALADCVVLHVNSFGGGVGMLRAAGLFGFRCRAGVSYADKPDLLTEDLRTLTEGGYRILLAATSDAEEAAVSERLRDAGFPVAPLAPDEPFAAETRPTGVVFTTHGVGVSGFELLVPRVAVLSLAPDEETARRARVRRARRKKAPAGQKLLSYAELREGDFVVHAVHGIGRFAGMTTMTVDGVTQDYITLQYAGTDRLFLPAARLEMITKYIGAGAEDGSLKLSRLGGAEWKKATGRAKAAAREMAKELIALYAARLRRPGHAFPPDDEMQTEFEDAFPYDETDSQAGAIEDIKRDMERPVPMDRLLCGDVGYGKTEVAFRAAFKAVGDGKQVAILVPTTILALQHYETALSRFRGFPVTVEMLSRFRTPKQQETILRRCARGEIDILIGTHKLLGKNLAFRDLGLLVVDEEQRFGVAQKEKLREMARDVDTLTLTATPIPRTLNMAMSGIRDISLLDEAPGDRHPVQTYVLEHDDGVIGEAITRELRRGGQVIYLYNRVETIASVAARLSAALPDARVVVAHGQMDKDDLEDIWQALCRGEIDVIVCTTIVETGVDLPNANTLIIEDADRLGLSQLHQIRGRVGRSTRQAYAYFTYRPGKALSDIATKRLSAIREYAEFGAGFKIALRDMEIRGAGNLLGAEQHGHIDAVGYELYIRLLNEAVLEEEGRPPEEKFEALIDIRADAYIPERYIPLSAGRMEMYKKISLITEEADLSDVADELRDRYGPLPPQVTRLLDVSLARALASKLRIPKVEGAGGEVRFLLKAVDLSAWSVLFAERKDLRFKKDPPAVCCHLTAGMDAAHTAREILCRYAAVEQEIAADTGKEQK